MRRVAGRFRLVAGLVLAAGWLGGPAVAGDPPRLRRADSFLGVHLDFHAGPDGTEVGKRTTPEMVDRIIDLVHPDYIQVDCKGHPGYSSYPTKVGNPVPGFVGDPLRVWRDATARRGVALYMHYSGVYDVHAVKTHPEWAAVHADGSPDAKATSPFGPYARQLVIPQLRELAEVYGVDGVWIDGDCWAAVPDYGPAARQAFLDATGFASLPTKPDEPAWPPFLDFHRQAYRSYLRRVVAGVKATDPEFQICSNWAFTDHMPEPVSAPVDFLSGDFSPQDSVNSARLSGRYLARQGRPWDLMAWSFTTKPGAGGNNRKSAVQLEREAAVILALGGGFQAYFTQERDGSLDLAKMPVMAEVAQFCRARQALCHHTEAVPQIALVFSTDAHYRELSSLFGRDNARIGGILAALLESRQSVEVLGEHQLAGRLGDYPLVVIPEWKSLDPAFRADLRAYVEQGGNLLLLGPESSLLLGDDPAQPASTTAQDIHLTHDGASTTLPGQALVADRLGDGVEPFGLLHETDDPASPTHPAATIETLGKGRVARTCFPMGRAYSAGPDPVARQFLDALVRALFPNPVATVTGSAEASVDVQVARKDGRLQVHLVNTSGPHRTEPVFDTIPPVGPLEVAIRVEQAPARVTLQPANVELPFTRTDDGRIRVTVPGLEVHEAVVIEP
jgi:hypothetical protein